MPHAIIETDGAIEILRDGGAYVGRHRALFPVCIGERCFFVTVYRKPGVVVVKVEKTTRPEITDDVKSAVLSVAEDVAAQLGGRIISHNLHPTGNGYVRCDSVVEKHNFRELRELRFALPVEVEIGCGTGEFIARMAARGPEKFFVGFETSGKAVTSIKHRICVKSRIKNITVFHGDGVLLLRLFGNNSVDAVYMNFPEPWFRFRRIKHSLSSGGVTGEIARILNVGGEFHLVTDNYPTAVASAVAICNSGVFEPVDKFWISFSRQRVGTRFERRWLKKNRIIYSVVAKKIKDFGFAEHKPEIEFPLPLRRRFIIDNGVIFKVLAHYSGERGEIVEVASGDVLRTQHVFFGYDGERIYPVSQSIFVREPTFLRALALAASQ